MQVVHIDRPVWQAMLAHLRDVYPLEGCGFLSGRNGRLQHHIPVHNILQSPTAYEMDPKQQIQAMLAIEAREDDTMAIYHSHPNGPSHPSETDVAQAYYPEAIYFIVSFVNFDTPTIDGFLIRENAITEIPCNLE